MLKCSLVDYLCILFLQPGKISMYFFLEPEKKEVQTDIKDVTIAYAGYETDSMVKFLRKVAPLVCSVLEKNIKSKAFYRYKLSSDTTDTTISCLHMLLKYPSSETEFCCSNISWNSVGTALAASYSYSNHMSWCEHDSCVNIWSLNRKDFDPKKPNMSLETDCCITCINFHPELPAIIVAGKLNGSLLLWDISKEDDPLLSSTETTTSNHREPITGIHWIPPYGKHNRYEFVSCSLDGKILLWKFENGTLQPYDGFIILAKQLPRNFQIKARLSNAEVGITSLSINVEDSSIFIIGIEGGGIFQCSFESKVPTLYSGASSVSLKNPINMGFERHKGQVTTVQFSPYSRNIFLSAGSDGELRIYSLLQPKPLLILQQPSGGINGAQWSTVRPLVIYCICNNGQLHIWDLVSNERSPTESCLLTLSNDSGISLGNNKENPGLLATCCSNGTVQVWEISGAALVAESSEVTQLQALSKTIE
ncbi:cytoplasmic dynein 2 intermediate chain 2 isoform X2 [Parasteatoda tepidariorum]|uniref:cytoplasmic dynein 2 intermediate chain 2 isoform X2 n=1 Tax=Parasteatoda tepidariorum TaxID=114398 RepID=UPI001C727CC2|nr:cytoplasmic dynein 2 intermediate chain 2 isoform X2 [Parasteatoda tepidariorum]